jgi:two-component system, response regulator PdtaR
MANTCLSCEETMREALQEPCGDQRPLYVLVAEDHPLVRAYLADQLRDAGFKVVEAASGDEALAYIESSAGIDLIFTDVQMPGTLDGFALAAVLRETNPSLPIIITSGNASPEMAEGLGTFIPKPYQTADVLSLVVRMIGIDPRASN